MHSSILLESEGQIFCIYVWNTQTPGYPTNPELSVSVPDNSHLITFVLVESFCLWQALLASPRLGAYSQEWKVQCSLLTSDGLVSLEFMPSKFFFPLYHTSVEKAMAPHSSTFAWKIPWMEEPGRVQSMGSLRVTSLSLFTFMHWRRKWQPAPVFLPGESQGRGSLVGCCL